MQEFVKLLQLCTRMSGSVEWRRTEEAKVGRTRWNKNKKQEQAQSRRLAIITNLLIKNLNNLKITSQDYVQ